MMKFIQFMLTIFLAKISDRPVNQQNIAKIEPLATYLESRACQYSFNVSCGNQSLSIDLENLPNGNSVIQNSWPWVVGIWAILNDSTITYFCSGFILSNRYILTNAKCIEPFSLSQLRIVIGSNITNPSSNYTFNVVKKLVHPYFNTSNIDRVSYNMALLILSTTITFSDTPPVTYPICLPISARYFSNILNQTVFTTSFIMGNSTNNTRELKQFKTTITNFYPSCTNNIGLNISTNYCTNESEMSTQNCTKSLGDGIMYFENKRWYIYGLLSIDKCSSYPLMYTQIPSNLWWFCEVGFVNCENF